MSFPPPLFEPLPSSRLVLHELGKNLMAACSFSCSNLDLALGSDLLDFMDPLIKLLHTNSKRTHQEMAAVLGISESEVAARIASAEADGTILGYSAVVDRIKAGHRGVTALIEVRITPERDGGFDRLARRISKFDQVRECFLMSGGYDLAVIVEGKDLLDVANFVAEKLSTLGGVLSTATRFQLKAYKEGGFLVNAEGDEERLPVSP